MRVSSCQSIWHDANLPAFAVRGGTAVDFTVVGTLNKLPGYILTGQAIDGGASGAGLDALSITIRTPTGDVVHASSGAVSEGDVVITP